MGVIRLASALSQPFLGVLADIVGSTRLIALGLAASGFSYFVLDYLPEISFIYALDVVQGTFFAATEMATMLRLMTIVSRKNLSRAMGVYGFAEDVGGMISSPTLNSVYDWAGPSLTLFLLASALVSGVVLSSLLGKQAKAKQRI